MKDITQEDLNKLLEASLVTPKEGDIVKATVIKRTENGVLLNLGLKAEGFLPLEEFTNHEDADEGKEIYVFLEAYENREGFPVISKKKADFQLAWDKIKHIYENGEMASCTIKKRIKGGYSVDLMGVEAFLPSSQIEYKSQANSESLIGQSTEVKIVKINMLRKNIVVSRKLAVEEEQAKARKRIFSKMKVGDIIDGTVAAMEKCGGYNIYNLGESSPITVKDLVAEIEKALGKKAVKEYVPPQPGDVERTYADVTKAAKELGYTPATTIEKGLAEFVDWLRGSA